jgi:hypothetical protein
MRNASRDKGKARRRVQTGVSTSSVALYRHSSIFTMPRRSPRAHRRLMP